MITHLFTENGKKICLFYTTISSMNNSSMERSQIMIVSVQIMTDRKENSIIHRPLSATRV